jgi:hypothetical protein
MRGLEIVPHSARKCKQGIGFSYLILFFNTLKTVVRALSRPHRGTEAWHIMNIILEPFGPTPAMGISLFEWVGSIGTAERIVVVLPTCLVFYYRKSGGKKSAFELWRKSLSAGCGHGGKRQQR